MLVLIVVMVRIAEIVLIVVTAVVLILVILAIRGKNVSNCHAPSFGTTLSSYGWGSRLALGSYPVNE